MSATFLTGARIYIGNAENPFFEVSKISCIFLISTLQWQFAEELIGQTGSLPFLLPLEDDGLAGLPRKSSCDPCDPVDEHTDCLSSMWFIGTDVTRGLRADLQHK